MDLTGDLQQVLKQLVMQATRYLQHYDAQVINNLDPMNLGRVQCAVPALGLVTVQTALWAKPRFINQMIIPEKDQWVDLWFMQGDYSYPVYLAGNIINKDMVPKAYDGAPTTKLIFNSVKNNADSIIYNDMTKELTLAVEKLNITAKGKIAITGKGGVLIQGGAGKLEVK